MRENPSSSILFLLNHGVLVIGSSLEEAFLRLELLNQIANAWVLSSFQSPNDCLLNLDNYSLLIPELKDSEEKYQSSYSVLQELSKRAYDLVYFEISLFIGLALC